jgi:hypothetical protein
MDEGVSKGAGKRAGKGMGKVTGKVTDEEVEVLSQNPSITMQTVISSTRLSYNVGNCKTLL